MKLKRVLPFVMSAVLALSSAGIAVSAKEIDYATLDESVSKAFERAEEIEKNLLDKGKSFGDSVKESVSDYKDLLNEYLEKAESIIEKPHENSEESVDGENSAEEFELQADHTEFTWDRSSENGIEVQTNSLSKEVTIYRNGRIFASSIINKSLSADGGNIYIDTPLLKKLDDGENMLELSLKEGKMQITVNVTDIQTEIPVPEKDITADKTCFEWDKSDLLGIAVNTDSKSKSVTITKDGEVIASSGDRGVYMIIGKVGITAKTLKKLSVGENKLTLTFDDGKIDITVKVTDKRNSSEEESSADKTESVSEESIKADTSKNSAVAGKNSDILSSMGISMNTGDKDFIAVGVAGLLLAGLAVTVLSAKKKKG